ncbi:MAG: GNAT family protein [Candidatus Hydrogenedentes bacterium]|nr:GNAT family protein [Candidatus Hydrogenedentota bacterium]
MRYFRKLVGKKCYLSPINVDDFELFTAWQNDLEVAEYLQASGNVVTLMSEKAALEKRAQEHNYEIIDLETDKPLGLVGLVRTDYVNRSGKLRIFIGDKAYLGKGYGREAVRLLLGYVFDYLNLNSVLLTVREDNTRAIACYTSVGFKRAGRYRQSILRTGRFHDEIVMDILAEEFRAANADR